MTELTPAACEREIEELHAFFVDWYRGEVPRTAFERVDGALASDFERVAPDGGVADREGVLDGIRETFDEYDTFDIEIRNVETRWRDNERALLRYDEHQRTPSGSNARRSVVLFSSLSEQTDEETPSATAPRAKWLYLQETWLDSPE